MINEMWCKLGMEDKKYKINKFFIRLKAIEKRKANIRLVLITTIVSIVLYTVTVYQGYSYIKLNECLKNNVAINSFISGKEGILHIEKDIITYGDVKNRVICKDNEVLGVIDEDIGYTKLFEQNILKSIRVNDPLADLKSYLNPLVWFGGCRTVNVDRVYEIRTDKEIINLREKIDEGGLAFLKTTNLQYIKYGDSYIITN